MNPKTFKKCWYGLWIWVSFVWLQGCVSAGPPAEPPIVAEVVSHPEGIEMTYRGKILGKAPLEVRLDRLEETAELSTTAETPPIIERRVKILSPERVQVLIRLGEAPTAVARALGLAKVVVFDYGSFATFDVDKYELKPNLFPMLRRQARTLAEYFGGLDVYVCGHTDSTGGGEHNQVLAVRRAQAVADFLIAQGLAGERVQVQGFGADYPIADNATREGRQLNRRTEIILPD